MKKLHIIHLSKNEQSLLRDIIGRGVRPARVIQRANILLSANDNLKDEEIAERFHCTARHVANVRKRYCTEDIERALIDAKRSGRPKEINEKHEQRIVALACTDPPDGAKRWTLELITEHAVKKKMVKQISPQSVWLILTEHDLKPWREKNVVHSKTHA
jgi:putative transposase